LGEIYPILEPSGSGISSLWARTTALKHECTVVAPYPEIVNPGAHNVPGHYNSAIIVNEDGETLGNYRKRHLHTTDETWASEGTQGFYDGELPDVGYAAVGLSMDLK
jgi:protein N-terminal amidase